VGDCLKFIVIKYENPYKYTFLCSLVIFIDMTKILKKKVHIQYPNKPKLIR